MDTPAYSIALTGGIASGKSAVAERFAALGASVIDADQVARELVARGSPALEEIVAVFGHAVLAADGTLDRAALRERIFAAAEARTRLNAILHPRIRAELHARACALAPDRYALLAIPLLAENHAQYAWADRVLVVDVPRELQLARLLARDRIAPHLAHAMLDAQASREQRLAIADDIIDNSTSLAALDRTVQALHARYLALAQARARG